MYKIQLYGGPHAGQKLTTGTFVGWIYIPTIIEDRYGNAIYSLSERNKKNLTFFFEKFDCLGFCNKSEQEESNGYDDDLFKQTDFD